MARSRWRLNGVLGVALFGAILFSLAAGPASLAFSDIWAGLIGSDEAAEIIIRDIRLPRTLIAVGVGCVLGISGAAAQSLTRNPLAEPAIFGTPQAAAFGAVTVLYLGLAPVYSLWLPITAICFAIVSLSLVFLIVRRKGDVISLLLAGLALGSLAGAATSFVISFSQNPFAVMEIVFWLMGSFEDRSMRHVYLAFPFFLIAVLLLAYCARGYQALTLGEDVAQSLGINVKRTSILTILGISIGVGAGVAVSGAIGFVGLVAPHAVRPFCGGEPRRLLVPAALAGGLLTVCADIAVRLIPSSGELRVGVLTAFIGVPWFIYLVTRNHGFISSRDN